VVYACELATNSFVVLVIDVSIHDLVCLLALVILITTARVSTVRVGVRVSVSSSDMAPGGIVGGERIPLALEPAHIILLQILLTACLLLIVHLIEKEGPVLVNVGVIKLCHEGRLVLLHTFLLTAKIG